MTENLDFHRPSLLKRMGEKFFPIGIFAGEVTPADIVPRDQLDKLFQTYPDLAGDRNIGLGDEGNCQSYYGCPGWWKEFV